VIWQLSSAEKAIVAALGRPVSIEFVEEPLADVVNDLKDLLEIEMQLDTRSLEDAGIPIDTPISLPRIKDVSLRSLLGLLNKKYGLRYLIQNDMLLLTSHDAVEDQANLVRKVYPVGDLVGGGDDYSSLLNAITTTVEPNSWQSVGWITSLMDLANAGL